MRCSAALCGRPHRGRGQPPQRIGNESWLDRNGPAKVAQWDRRGRLGSPGGSR
ncbi:hypothetical protein ACFFX0_25770 [Citricoccus parietis]|uniref:Uncharacterized protein n=1 Tax=Citricoccus parietis TaxID=592307 RepID=A0ABV5G640_9MICC